MHILTSADVDSGLYSIRDIVLPAVGTATVFPGNKVADRYMCACVCACVCVRVVTEQHFMHHGTLIFHNRLTSFLSEVGLTLKSFRSCQFTCTHTHTHTQV